MSEPDSTFHAEEEFVADPGLDEQSVGAMTGEQTKQYLALLLKVLRPDLPSLAWLRRADSSKSGGPQSASQSPHALGSLRKLLVDGKPPISP